VNNNNLSVPQIIILASGGVMLIGSFLDFFKGANAWGSGAFPIITLIPLLGIVSAVVIALKAFANVNLPDRVLTLNWVQIHLVLGVYAALMMLAWLLVKTGGSSVDRGAGFWLLFLGAIGLIVGAVMLRNESPSGAAPSAGPTSF
jgi:hypothetical protein